MKQVGKVLKVEVTGQYGFSIAYREGGLSSFEVPCVLLTVQSDTQPQPYKVRTTATLGFVTYAELNQFAINLAVELEETEAVAKCYLFLEEGWSKKFFDRKNRYGSIAALEKGLIFVPGDRMLNQKFASTRFWMLESEKVAAVLL